MAVVTYGNRAFDNSLAELCAVLKDNKMHVVAATAAPCRHSFTDLLAKGRPDGEDMRALISYGTRLAAYIKAKDILPDTPLIPGDADAPYYVPKGIDGKPAKFLKAKPKTDMDLCISCGTCAAVCPMGSIDSEDTAVVSGICIKCQACVYSCPKKAKYFDDPALLSHIAMLKENYGDAGTDRKGIEFFPSLP
jgi:ferredoxin